MNMPIFIKKQKNNTSPDKIAILVFHFSWTFSFALRSGASSIMSSWMREKLWNNSTARAADMLSSTDLLNSFADISVNIGLIRFPPKVMKYRSGSYKFNGEEGKEKVEISFSISLLYVSSVFIFVLAVGANRTRIHF